MGVDQCVKALYMASGVYVIRTRLVYIRLPRVHRAGWACSLTGILQKSRGCEAGIRVKLVSV